MRMETIKLKEKKIKINKKTLWICLLPSVCIIFIVLFNLLFHRGYEYYIIQENNKKIKIGFSTEKNLIDDTVTEYLHKVKEDGCGVLSFNLKKYYVKKSAIAKRSRDDTSDIRQSIEKNIYVKIDAVKIEVKDKTLLVKFSEGRNVIERLKKLDKKINLVYNNVYIDYKDLSSQNDIENFISTYKK